jgi:hypothetical protein
MNINHENSSKKIKLKSITTKIFNALLKIVFLFLSLKKVYLYDITNMFTKFSINR